jgi:hypothetical protein
MQTISTIKSKQAKSIGKKVSMNIQKFFILFLLLFPLTNRCSFWSSKKNKKVPLQKPKVEKEIQLSAFKSEDFEEVEESAPGSDALTLKCTRHFNNTTIAPQIYTAIIINPIGELAWTFNRDPRLLYIKFKEHKSPIDYAQDYKNLLEKNSGAEKQNNDLQQKIRMMKLAAWKQNFNKAYQTGIVQLPFSQQNVPALDAIIVGYLIDARKPQQLQKQVEN